ncbi:tetratricopeptide repeat protein [Silvibacterium sp.]|uniref:tetratricopeptide repeat protein n=1 Tax=Silvibacterium sp. TaxID=1964179 RepID=UPI0039E3766D
MAIDPGNFTAHMLLGQAYRQTGRRDQAQQQFQAAQRLQSPASSDNSGSQPQ